MKTRLILSGVILLSVFTLSCKTKQKPIYFAYGRIENNKYSNSFFKFEITIPKNRIVVTNDLTENLTQTGKGLKKENDTKTKAVKVSEIFTFNLLAAYKYKPDSVVDFNPSIMIVVENVENAPIETGSDHFKTRNYESNYFKRFWRNRKFN